MLRYPGQETFSIVITKIKLFILPPGVGRFEPLAEEPGSLRLQSNSLFQANLLTTLEPCTKQSETFFCSTSD